MLNEPTALERQRSAFKFLRENAVHAHVAGDGLLVNLLCHTGLDRAAKLADKNQLLLPLVELAWMPIFALYWLVNEHERYIVAEALKKLPRTNAEDTGVGDWLDHHSRLIDQPLSTDPKITSELSEVPNNSFFETRSIEAETLLTHLIELIWFRSADRGDWKAAAESWEATGPSWARDIIKGIRLRLTVQTRLTTPSNNFPMFPESANLEVSDASAFAELWLYYLYGRRELVAGVVERLTPKVSGDSHQWRILTDFAGMADRTGPEVEERAIHLARRRRLSADTPLLIFHDKREQQMESSLSELYRDRREDKASRRWGVWSLAMLHELSALRLWDYGMWQAAIQTQSGVAIETMQWTRAHTEMAAQSLVLAVRGMTARDADKDAMTRRVIDILEFAPAEALSYLADGLLSTYPLQKHNASELLKDVTDLLPYSAWPELANWTVSYAREAKEQRTMGWRLAPAGHWLWALLAIPAGSPVWATLQKQVLDMARIPHCWRGDESAGILLRWLKCAPIDLATEVAKTLAEHPEEDLSARVARAELIVDFEEWHDLRGAFSIGLLTSAKSASERLLIGRHLKVPDLAEHETKLRERLSQRIREAIARATPPIEVQTVTFEYPQGTDLVKEWQLEDLPLLEELVAATNSPAVFAIYLPWLISVTQLIVANGPAEFAKFVHPHLVTWIDSPPRGRSQHTNETGPFSVVNIGATRVGDIDLYVGWLFFQLPRKLGSALNRDFLVWAKAMLLTDDPQPLQIVIYGAATIALGAPSNESEESFSLTEIALSNLWSRASEAHRAAMSLAAGLGYIASLFRLEDGTSTPIPDSYDEIAKKRLFDIFERFLPRLARSPRSGLRAAVGELLCRLEQHDSLPESLRPILEFLRRDNRARVRVKAAGGWSALKKKSQRQND